MPPGAGERSPGKKKRSTKASLVASFDRQAQGPPAAEATRAVPPLLEENRLAWEVVIALYNRRAFEREQFMVALPMGGVVMRSTPVAFRVEALVQMVEFLAGPEERRDVLERVGWVEPIAVRAAGRDAKGTDS